MNPIPDHEFYSTFLRKNWAKIWVEEKWFMAKRTRADTEQPFQHSFDSIPALLWSSIPGKGNDYMNQAWLDFTGLRLEQALGEGWKQALHPEDIAVTEQKWEQAVRTPATFDMVRRMRRYDGEYRWFLTRVQPVLDEIGQVTKWMGVDMDITERQQAEAALQESEQRFSTIFHSSHDIIGLVRLADEVYLDVNDAFCTAFGVERQQVIDRPGLDLSFWARPGQRGEFVNLLLAQGKVVDFETEFCSRTGAKGWMLLSGTQVHIEGQPCVLFSCKDITRRKLDEQELRDSEEKHRVLFTNKILAICIYDINTLEIIDANQAFASLYGFSPEELTGGMTARDVNPDYDAYRFQPLDVLLEGSTFIPMVIHRKKDGTRFPVEMYITPSEWKVRRVAYAMIHDITERVEAERALKESEATLNSFFNTTQYRMGIFRSLPDENDLEYLRLNPAALTYLGHPPEAIPGLRASVSGLSDANRRVWLEQCRLSQESGQPAQFEYLREFPDGEHWMLATLNAIEAGIFSFAVSDITRHKAMQNELQQLNQELEGRVGQRTAELSRANQDLKRAVRLRDEFLNNMSHELRTPLAGILSLSEALKRQAYGPVNERQDRALANIHISGERLHNLVENLLEMTQLAAGKVILAPYPVSVDQVIKSCLGKIQAEVERKQLRLHTRRDLLLVDLVADEKRLRQILDGLLDNAVKFTPAGGKVGLEVDVDQQAQLVRWVVWDTGIGIPTEQHEQLFELFVQLDGGLSRHYGGTGLGLAMVKQLVDLHGGSISIESTPGQGSRFTVSLPWVQVGQGSKTP